MKKYVNKVQAILNLVGGGISAVDEDVTYLSGQTPPTDAEIDAEVARLQVDYDAKKYQRDRQPEYPPIADQQDMQFHDAIDGTTTWQDAIQAVKDKYPKPE